jgi:hypothetical protein
MTIEVNQVIKTNRDGDVLVLSISKKFSEVKFLNTGFIRSVHTANLEKGKCADTTITDRKKEREVNIVLLNNAGDELTMLSKKGNQCVVQFTKTGYTTKAYIENVVQGKIKDPYSPSTYNIGYPGLFNKKLSYCKQAQQLWRNMMKRCYSEADKKGYFGKGVTVDTRWHCFANFLDDISSLDNFHNWLNADKTGINYNLDKDFKFKSNKVYSKETCMFLQESINKSCTSRTNKWDDR